MNVAVVGCGYVGLVTGVGLASVGHEVTGVEVDPSRREAIAAGRPPFHEPGLEDLLRAELRTGRFRVVARLDACAEADVVFLAVQTPPTPGGTIDLTFVERAARELGDVFASASPRDRVVATRSTVLPGTATGIVGPALGGSASVASNPEFLAEGTAVADFLRADRIVVGCDDELGRRLLSELYEPLGAPVVLTSPATAEVAKYASNALLATLISFSNEIARVCERLPGVDVEDVLGILHRDRRLSPVVDGALVRPGILSYLKAGCGFGGSCLPKDLSALVAEQAAHGFQHPLLQAVLDVNEGQARRVVDVLESRIGALARSRVALLGVAFKGGTDDVRASPGLRILDELLDRGAAVTVYDPLVRAETLSAYTERGVRTAATLGEACAGVDACVVTTNAPEFAALPGHLTDANAAPIVVDGRRVLSPESVGPAYAGVGRGPES